MDRRTFLEIGGVGALALTASSRLCAQQQPNLLIIHTDEHNLRTLGCYRKTLSREQARLWGPEAIVETPNIDALAAEGAICTRFYATTPVCSPSRSALMSGLYPHHTPVTTNNIPMRDDIITFAELLRRRGYATGYAGKWHLDGPGKPQWAPKRKFGFQDNRYMFNRGHWKQLEDTPTGPRVKARNAKGQPSYDVKGADERSFTTDFLTDKAIAFLEAHGGRPFCFMVSYPDPHGPNSVRPPYDTMFSSLNIQAPPSFKPPAESIPKWGAPHKKKWNGAYMARYFGMVKCIDDNVGRLLRALQRTGRLDDTVVVFTADHGDLCGEHGRDNKGVPFETSARIPFVVRYPARVPGGLVIERALGCVDFLPTVMRLMGFDYPSKVEGRDASGLFRGESPPKWENVAFFRSTSSAKGGWLSAVSTRYKLIVSGQDKPWLYDLENDPNELVNQLERPEHRSAARDLGAALLTYARRFGDPYIDLPGVRADLEWCAKGAGAYPGHARA